MEVSVKQEERECVCVDRECDERKMKREESELR